MTEPEVSDGQYVQSDKGLYTYERPDINVANLSPLKVGSRCNCRISGHPGVRLYGNAELIA